MQPFRSLLVLVVMLVVPALSHAGLRFRPTFTDYKIGYAPLDAAIADLDSDDIADLAVPISGSGSGVVLMKGLGDGTFTVMDTLAVSSPRNIVAADLNDDNKTDLILVGSGGTMVFVGHGDLTFDPPVTYGAGLVGIRLAVGDVNGDTIPDIVASDSLNTLNVRPGVGDGSFGAPLPLTISGYANGVAIGDFDGNGFVDVAAATAESVMVYRQTSAGTFAPRVSYASASKGLAAGLIDGDALPDLVRGASWLKSHLDGPPDAPVSFGAAEEELAGVADLDGDGTSDVVASSGPGGEYFVVVHRGLGGGSFDVPRQYRTGAGVAGLTLGDVDGDGHVDVVTTCSGFGQLVIHPGAGDGTLLAPPDLPMPGDPWQVEIAEVTGDTHADVLAIATSAAVLRIFPGRGDGSFDTPVDLSTPADPRRFALGDVNDDGIADLITANGTSNSISVFPGTGSGFGARSDYPMPAVVLDVAVADLGGDHVGDVLACGGGYLSVFPGQTAAGLGTRVDYTGPGDALRVFAGRVDADTLPDVEVLDYGAPGKWWNYPGTGGGVLGTPASVTVSALGSFYPAEWGLAADLTGDGKLDLLTSSTLGLAILVGNGDGTFDALPAQTTTTIESRNRALLVADFDGDLYPDLFTANWFTAAAAVYHGDGSGYFPVERGYGSNGFPTDVALGDLDENGMDDAAVANEITASVSILLDATGASTAVDPLPARANALAFTRVWPVPRLGGPLHASFVLPGRGEARLDLLDVAGRRVAGERLGVLEAGEGNVTLALPRTLRPGIYWLRLTHGGRATAARVAVLR